MHVFTSPHLVRFNERIRLAGSLVEDAVLAEALGQVIDISGDIEASFFEVTTAAAFMLFARVPADACVIEVGLGGRLDATNVIKAPVACASSRWASTMRASCWRPRTACRPIPIPHASPSRRRESPSAACR